MFYNIPFMASKMGALGLNLPGRYDDFSFSIINW
jgi:hypothetical protein